MSDLQSTRGRSVNRIANVIAQARQEVANPSLENPTRPITPAGFDDRQNIGSNLSFHNLRTAANSRQTAAIRSANFVRSSLSKSSKLKELKAAVAETSAPIVDSEEAIPPMRMANTSFNPPMLLRDLTELEAEFDVISLDDVTRMLNDQIQELIKFLQSLPPGTDLASELVNTIENIVMKFSGITMMMLRRHGAEPVQILSLLRVNLRILAPMFSCSYVAASGAFDVGFISLNLKHCTEAIFQLCAANQSPDASGNKVLDFVSTPAQDEVLMYDNNNRMMSSDIYRALDEDGDIEEEDAEGQFVPMKPSSSSHRAPTTGAVDAHNNCELVGSTQMLQILELLWPAIHKELRSQENGSDEGSEKPNILPHLVEAMYYIARVFVILSRDETDCKRLNSAGAVRSLMTGVKVFQLPLMLRCIKSSLAQRDYDEDDDYQSDTIYTSCLSQILIVLRNFSMVRSCKNQLQENDVVSRLCLLTKSYLHEPQIVVDCARVVCKLSVYEWGREQIKADSEHIHWLADVVIHEANQMGGGYEWPGEHTWAIITRICFTLGNLTTTNVENRRLIGTEFGLTEHLVLLLQVCADTQQSICRRNAFEQNQSGGYDSGSDGEHGDGVDNSFLSENSDVPRRSSKMADKKGRVADQDMNDSMENYNYIGGQDQEQDQEEQNSRGVDREFIDATIKLVRLLANLSIDEQTGTALGSKANTLEMLVMLLLSAMEGGSTGHEELLLNVIAACTNITFYSSQYVNKCQQSASKAMTSPKPGRTTVADRILEVSTQLSAHLGQCLFHENSEIVLEAARVLGNLTRNASIRSSLIDTRADETLVILLKHDQWDIVAAVTGVLVNLSADAHCKAALLKPSSHLLIVFSVVLRKVATEYLELSSLICQALYNLLLGSPPAASDSRTIQERIHKTLVELNDSVRADDCSGTGDEGYRAQCASFVKVSSAVMALIEKHRDTQGTMA